jgi:hypothetical protein
MTSKRLKNSRSDDQGDRRWSRAAIVISAISLIVSVVFQSYQIHRDRVQKHDDSITSGKLAGRIDVLSTSVRVLTGVAAPQLQQAIDDSLRSAIESKDVNLVGEKAAKVAASIRILDGAQVMATSANLSSQSDQMLQLVHSNETLPSVWDAATQLVTYKSAVESRFKADSSKNCFETFERYTPHPNLIDSHIDDMLLNSCYLVIDDVVGFDRSQFGKTFSIERSIDPSKRLRLVLTDVKVVYRGGTQVLPFFEMIGSNCTFELASKAVPDLAARQFIAKLLTAELRKFTLSISS